MKFTNKYKFVSGLNFAGNWSKGIPIRSNRSTRFLANLKRVQTFSKI